MIKEVRLLAICMICAAFLTSIARAQSYKQIDYPGATGTALLGGPNPQGTSVGFYSDSAFVFHGFTLDSNGVFTSFDPPGSTFTTPNFITPQGFIVGAYNDAGNVSHGFVLYEGRYTTIDFPGAAGTTLTGLNPSGVMVGFTCSDPACGATGAATVNHSFTVSNKGAFTSFDPPGTSFVPPGPGGTSGSEAAAISATGEVVGAYYDSNGVRHGYVLNNGKFSTTDFSATFTFDGGVNPEGDIIGAYQNGSVQHSFLLSNGVLTSFDPPGTGTASDATGINPEGIIVGVYADSAGVLHGFIRTP